MAKAPSTATSSATASFEPSVLQTGAEGALTALANAGERAADLVEGWIRAGNAAAVNAAAEGATGPVRKVARRGLNVLKSRGVELPQSERVATVTGKKEEETLEAWLVAPDGRGSSLIVIAARSPSSRYRAIFAYLAPSVGVHQARTLDLSHSQLRETMQGSIRGGQYRPVKVPLDWARFRISEARRQQKERGFTEPFGFAGSEKLLADAPAGPVEHPFDAEGLELGDDDARDLAAKSGELHQTPEFIGWLPAREAVDELLAKLGEHLTPDTRPEPAVFDELMTREIAAAADRFFTPERRTELVAMMKDSALSVLAREGEAKALLAVAAMRAVERAGLITDPPHEVPFLRGFFEKAIAVLLAQGNGQLRIPVRKPPTA